jgi:hypothetical protein
MTRGIPGFRQRRLHASVCSTDRHKRKSAARGGPQHRREFGRRNAAIGLRGPTAAVHLPLQHGFAQLQLRDGINQVAFGQTRGLAPNDGKEIVRLAVVIVAKLPCPRRAREPVVGVHGPSKLSRLRSSAAMATVSNAWPSARSRGTQHMRLMVPA